MKRVTQKNQELFKKIKILLACSLFVVLNVAFLMKVNNDISNRWWKTITEGQLFLTPVLKNNHIFIGSNYGFFNAIDIRTGKKTWEYSLDDVVASDALIVDGHALFTSENGTLHDLNISDGKEAWRFSSPGNYRFTNSPISYHGSIFIADANGTLWALNKQTGKIQWRINSQPVTRLSQLPLGHDGLQWRAFYETSAGFIYYAGLDGHVYAIDIKTGSIIWTFNADSAITTPLTTRGGALYFGTKSGRSLALNQRSGHIIWSSQGGSQMVCVYANGPLESLLKISSLPLKQLIIFVSKFVSVGQASVVEAASDGTITLASLDHKKIFWQYHMEDGLDQCPVSILSSVYVQDSKRLMSLNAATGLQQWSVSFDAPFLGTPTYYWQQPHISWNPLKIHAPSLMIAMGDGNGVMRAVSSRTGKVAWKSACAGQIMTAPTIDNNHIYFSCSDGGIYNISIPAGTYEIPLPQTLLSHDTQNAGSSVIQEFTLSHNESPYTDVFSEVSVKGEMTHEGGASIVVPGFYYDKNTWKLRFNPPTKGVWKWKLYLTSPLGTFSQEGELISSTDTKNVFFKISKTNPKRMTLDQQAIFNGIGIENTVYDNNQNGNPLDDWAIGMDNSYIASYSGAYFKYNNETITDLRTFASTYGPGEGGFNIYRWSINNASFNLWEAFSFRTKYLTQNGKYGDDLVRSMKGEGYHIWLTMFGFGIPFNSTSNQDEMTSLKQYIRYVVARYGAYVSMWEIANEAVASDKLVDALATYIKSIDPEKRPVAMSWDHPELASIDVITPHWYLSTYVKDTDLLLIEQINAYKKFQKPILFGEMGETGKNWSKQSALQMRVRSWIAFFNEAMLVFWNQSEDRDFYNPVFKNANQYIGPEERVFTQNLQLFTANVATDAAIMPLHTTNSAVRSYGLRSSKEIMGYFFHFANTGTPTTVSVSVVNPSSATLTWYSPSSGKILASKQISKGALNIVSPSFQDDIALKISFNVEISQ